MRNVEDDAGIPPRPWTVWTETDPSDNSIDVWGILDANGEEVMITDAGYYPPNLETALFICKCVNKT